MKLAGKTVHLAGKFELGKKELVQMRSKAQGASLAYDESSFFDYLLVGNNPSKRALKKAEERGAETLGHDEACELLSVPLHAYADRFKQSIRSMEDQKKYHLVLFKHIGEPASAKAIAAAEEKIGMPLDPVLKRFYEQMNGATIGYRTPFRPELNMEFELVDGGGPYSHDLFMDPAPKSGEFWRCYQSKKFPKGVGTLNIPPIEDLFLSSWGEYFGMEKEKVSFGKKAKVKGSDIFLFDATYGYQPIYLGIERRKKVMSVALGHDHAASFSDFPKVDLETYLEQFVHGSHLSLHTRWFGGQWIPMWWST